MRGVRSVCAQGINSAGTVVSHNLIHDMPHYGITAQDGFGRVTMEYNEIRDTCLEIADCGGIETSRWFPIENDKNLADGNLVRNSVGCGAYGKHQSGKEVFGTKADGRIWVPYYSWGIYFDNSPLKTTVYGNIVIGNTLGGISMPVSDPRENLVENNIFVEGRQQQMDLGMGGAARGNRSIRNVAYYTEPGSAALRTRNGHGVAECDYNLYFRKGKGKLTIRGVNGESLAKWREMGFDKHSRVADPLFVDAASGDYRLKQESPTFQLGFKPIPIDRIGLRTKHVGPPTR